MKTVLITGASKGIGLETALAFGSTGYKVYATMRSPEKSHSFKETIKNEALAISIHKMDVDDDRSVNQCINTIHQEVGNIDVLVNNAGIEHHNSVEEMPISDFKSIMETNYFGAIRCIKSVLPQMRSKQRGCIINVTSISGKIANSPLGAYAASKHALEAISEALAQEVKPFHIKVRIVEPGIINTEMAQAMDVNENSIYPNTKRSAGLFQAALKTPTPPSLVADKILEVAEENNWNLRHPVGSDAAPFLEWRSTMGDEDWVEWNAVSDEEWYASVERGFSLDARPEKLTKTK